MNRVEFYEDKYVYILANDKEADDFANEFIHEFVKKQNNCNGFIFVIYHVKDEIILLHFKTLKNKVSFKKK